jgi:hypothetical protein
MENQEPKSHARLAASIVLLSVIAASIIAAAYLRTSSPSPTSQSKSSTSTITTSTTSAPATSTASSHGIELRLSDNATTLDVGQRLNVNVSIFNTLSAVNSVLPSSDWAFQGVPAALWGSCTGAYPVEAVVLNGNYTAQELPYVANSTFQYTCAGFVNVDRVIFQPNSDQANITGTGPGPGVNQTLGPYHLSLNFTTTGYWDLANQSQLNPPILGSRPPVPTPFVAGTYTLAVSDEWGQEAVVYFTVKDG